MTPWPTLAGAELYIPSAWTVWTHGGVRYWRDGDLLRAVAEGVRYTFTRDGDIGWTRRRAA